MSTLHKLNFGDATIEYTLRRSSRRKKTVQISRFPGGAVVISAPMRTPNREIQAIVQKRGWMDFSTSLRLVPKNLCL